ncbi:hypothetical protein J6590_008319, partial [Homalodisca vitripennis]
VPPVPAPISLIVERSLVQTFRTGMLFIFLALRHAFLRHGLLYTVGLVALNQYKTMCVGRFRTVQSSPDLEPLLRGAAKGSNRHRVYNRDINLDPGVQFTTALSHTGRVTSVHPTPTYHWLGSDSPLVLSGTRQCHPGGVTFPVHRGSPEQRDQPIPRLHISHTEY